MLLKLRSKDLCYLSLFIIAIALSACSHPLKVKNANMYSCSIKLGECESKPTLAILPYSGKADDLFYFNALVNRLNSDPSFESVRTNYIPSQQSEKNQPDLILTISPISEYRSSGWNFFINWPGFLIFTPAWNGYIYYADIKTTINIKDRNGVELAELVLPISYDVRQAEFDRTVWTGVTWLEYSVLAFIGGIYNANTFDRDIIGDLQLHIKDNYSNYVTAQLNSKIETATQTLAYNEQ